MEPKHGDEVYIVDCDGNKTHNKTYIEVVWESYDNIWHIHDKFAVPMKIRWDGESWVQCIERQSAIKTKRELWTF